MKSMLLAIVIFLSISSFSYANDENPIILILNEDIIHFESVMPQIKNGTTYIPLRNMVDSMGAKLSWNEKEKNIIIKKKSKKISVNLNEKTIRDNNGNIISSDVYIEKNMTMIPFRVMATYFGYDISYIQNHNVIRAKKNRFFCVSDENLLEKLKEKINNERKRILNIIREKNKKDKKIAYITFDDGPSRYTNEILNILNKYDAKATFFLLGNNMIEHPDETEKLLENGNSIGLHGVTHDYKRIYKSPEILVNEMNADNEILFNNIGIKSNLIRTPYGSKPYMTKKFRDEYVKYGYKMWDWNIDSRDSLRAYVEPTEIIENVKKQLEKFENSNVPPIVLMHETYHTTKALEEILKHFDSLGYTLLPINYKQVPYNYWNEKR